MPVTKSEISALKKYVRLTNYLAASQIYLRDNVLLERELRHEDIKPRLLGHWGTCPGINFVYAQINRLIQKTDADFLYIVGPGHGFPALQANLFVEKSLTKYYPKKIPFNKKGIKEICEKFSAPYGYPSHSNPAAPGAILEGGELGYSLAVAFGSVLDNPELITVCLVGDGESETGPLAAAWQTNKILSPIDSGAVLPIVHLNGYKISGPTVLGRMDDVEIRKLFEGYGYEPHFVAYGKGDVYIEMAKTMDLCYKKIRAIQKTARSGKDIEKPHWPMIVMRTPKGWSGPKFEGDKKLEGNCLSHQVVLENAKTDPIHLRGVEEWLKSYKSSELLNRTQDTGHRTQFDLDAEIRSLIPRFGKACGSQKFALGGAMLRPLKTIALERLAIKLAKPGVLNASSMERAGEFLRAAFRLNRANKNLRLFSPDETYSNKLEAVFAETARSWQWPIKSFDEDLSRDGRVMEMLSEHTLFGMLHGYTVTGRHGIFASYEAFTQVVASMCDQYAKFIKASAEVSWRKPLPALNLILTSLLERQDHNGFSHQNPSLISSMMEKDGNIISTYLPPDANCMLVTMEKIFQDRDSLNLVVSDKKDLPQWLTLTQARQQMDAGIMTWYFASDRDPQIVLAASGDYVTREALAAITLLKKYLPKVRIRFVNISELTALGVGDQTTATNSTYLDKFFTPDKSIVFNFHGYPHTIKKLLFDYTGSQRVKVNGYIEEGSTTTPFDMQVRNRTSRYHLVIDLAEKLYIQKDISRAQFVKIKTDLEKKLKAFHTYIIKNGLDPKEISDWFWNG